MTRNIPIFAHRGASGYALENTFKAFKKAKELGADGIEVDVQCTKDNVLVVYHDEDLFRLTGKRKKIDECTYDELQTYPLGKHFYRRLSKERIPTLEEVVKWANDNHMPLNIELKETLLNNVDVLNQFLRRVQLPEGSHFSSFHEALIKNVKMQRPDLKTGYIITRKFNWNELSETSHFDAIHASKRYYKQELLDLCKKANKGIRFYNIVGTETFLTDPHPSVMGWITDYPNKVAKKVNNNKQTFKK